MAYSTLPSTHESVRFSRAYDEFSVDLNHVGIATPTVKVRHDNAWKVMCPFTLSSGDRISVTRRGPHGKTITRSATIERNVKPFSSIIMCDPTQALNREAKLSVKLARARRLLSSFVVANWEILHRSLPAKSPTSQMWDILLKVEESLIE